ncbi:MAG: hypothetical protein PHW54_03905 [Candidatus Omnitrophica bacterium]|jgi:hypothetical protein|nr:hypothetical protein [Candidatus Omnitrophota bacterium]
MKEKIILFLGIMFSFILINAGFGFCQDEEGGAPPVQEAYVEPEMQWLWGETVSVDTAARKILIKYLDYETDTEKEITIDVNDKTTFENINSMDGIKPADILSIDYVSGPDGKNTARNISVEKPESAETLPRDITREGPQATPASE